MNIYTTIFEMYSKIHVKYLTTIAVSIRIYRHSPNIYRWIIENYKCYDVLSLYVETYWQ